MAQKSSRGLRVLFIHGSEAETNAGFTPPLAKYLQAQADYLEWHFGIFPNTFSEAVAELTFMVTGNSRNSNIAWTLSVQTHSSLLRSFKPDVIVGSSFGATIVLQLLKDKKWEGPTVLLAPLFLSEVATIWDPQPIRPPWATLFAPTIPEGVACTVVRGLRDTVTPLSSTMKLATSGSKGLVRMLQPDDTHELRLLLGNDPAHADDTPLANEDSLHALVVDTYERHHSSVFRSDLKFTSKI